MLHACVGMIAGFPGDSHAHASVEHGTTTCHLFIVVPLTIHSIAVIIPQIANRRTFVALRRGLPRLSRDGKVDSFQYPFQEIRIVPAKSWILTDVERDQYVEHLAIEPDQVGGKAGGYSVVKRTLHGGLREGVDVVEVDNGQLKFTVVPTRGMNLWKAWLGEMQIGWNAPVQGPVHPNFVRLSEASGLGWLDGFDELLTRCGLESNGVPEFDERGQLRYGLHGKIANTPAHKVEVRIDGDTGTIQVCGAVDESRLFGKKLRLTTTIGTQVGRPEISITDTVTNISAEPSELELLYHINFGAPLLGEGWKAVFPVKKLCPVSQQSLRTLSKWDHYRPECAGIAEADFHVELLADSAGWTQTLLKNAEGSCGVSLKINKTQLPYLTLWKNLQAAADGYVTGTEPGINFPNACSFEKQQGRVAVLAPGESRTFEIILLVLPDAQSVAEVERSVARLQGNTAPEICPQPDPTWVQVQL
jgi:hypothetical protein